MSEDDTFIVGEPLPRIATVAPREGFEIAVTWKEGPRAGKADVVDLGPELFKFKLYAPLRSDPALFRTVRVENWGSTLAWDRVEADMPASKVQELAAQAMTSVDFAAFVKRHGYTLDGVAAELGISRRQAAYFQSGRAVPRTVALACAYVDQRTATGAGQGEGGKSA